MYPLARRAFTLVKRELKWAPGSAVTVRSVHDSAWAEKFKAATVDLASMDVDNISYQDSAERLRTLLKSGLLKHTDLNDNPERFFLAHRILAEKAPLLGESSRIKFIK